ncbi:MAG: DUF4136 domain-containing protein [Burkholderiaceae bacterium]
MPSVPKPHSPFISAAAAGAASLLAGCAGLHTVDATVASYGAWPAGMKPGTYAFDRLPSQQSNPQRQRTLEAAAAQALAAAGFTPAADGGKPGVTVQLGARIERFDASPWDDPLWWSGPRRGFYPGWTSPYGPGPWGSGWGRHGYWGAPPLPQPDFYEREVALLIRDAATAKPLYETHASNDGNTAGGERLLAAMFDASMKDFPAAAAKPHRVAVDLTMVPAAPPASAAGAP